MGPFLHQWLTATQYIAPMMANFDTSLGNNSDIKIKADGNKDTLLYDFLLLYTLQNFL